MNSPSSQTEHEMLYKAAVESADINVISRASANAVIERLMSGRNDATATDLTTQIQQAAATGDTDLIFKLADDLRQAKEAEKQRNSRLLKMADEFSLTDVMRAFPAFRDLVYELGLLVLQTTETNLKARRPRSSSGTSRKRTNEHAKGTVFIISHNGQSIEAQKNVGAAKLPGAEKEFFTFLGFDITPDGRMLDPATFTNHRGELVAANSKKAVIEDMLAGGAYWVNRGFRIKVKEEHPEQQQS